MPCVCLICRAHFVLSRMTAVVCEDCEELICPFCHCHSINAADGATVNVPPAVAASVRASVWGRGN